MTNTLDPFFQFIDQYEQRNILHALQSIISSPEIMYEDLASNIPIFRHLINFVDATVFETVEIVIEAHEALDAVIRQDKNLSVYLNNFLELLKKEQVFIELFAFIEMAPQEEFNETESLKIFRMIKEKKILSHEIIHHLIEKLVPIEHQEFINSKLHIINGWNRLLEKKSYLERMITHQRSIFQLLPWHSFAYSPLTTFSPQTIDSNKTPLLFLEPVENFDYKTFFLPFKDRYCITIMDTVIHFLHLLQFHDVINFFLEQSHNIYILELYPQQQIELQDMQQTHSQDFAPVFIIPKKGIVESLSLFIDTFMQCLSQNKNALNTDSPIANLFYQISQRILSSREVEKYGKSRSVAWNVKEEYRLWFDSHKGLPPPKADLGPLPKNYFQDILNELNAKREPRVFAPEKKVRLAHIVPQIAHINHAPTKLTVNLLKFADRLWFDTFLISTEKTQKHLLDYPLPKFHAESSAIRGATVLEYLNMLGVKIHIEPEHLTYEKTAQILVKLLKDLKIDIAIFHGPDPVNLLISSSTDVPIRVLFEHGTLPHFLSFDLAILSNEENYLQFQHIYKKAGMESCFLNYSINVKEKWKDQPYTKEELGFPPGSFIMTTVSNHLEIRLSTEMCQAIGEILSRYSHVYYALIGPVSHPTELEKRFEPYQIKDRIKFFGTHLNPSQLLRSMDLYLNEFPFGSGLTIVEAMAAGCPIVSMYDEHGPAQAKYGGIYFGKEWVIQSGDKKEYIELACRLINDSSFYKTWSNHAQEQYAKRENPEQFVKTFENLLSEFIDISYLKKRLQGD